MTPEEMSLRGRIGAHAVHAKYDGREITANARATWLASFVKKVDQKTPGLPDPERLRRAEHLLRAHMGRLALKSAKARRKAAPP